MQNTCRTVILTLTLVERPQVVAPLLCTFLVSDEPHLCLLLSVHRDPQHRVKHSRSQIQMEDPDVADTRYPKGHLYFLSLCRSGIRMAYNYKASKMPPTRDILCLLVCYCIDLGPWRQHMRSVEYL